MGGGSKTMPSQHDEEVAAEIRKIADHIADLDRLNDRDAEALHRVANGGQRGLLRERIAQRDLAIAEAYDEIAELERQL